MSNPTVAVVSPGDMGHGVAHTLHAGGLRVITCLAGRSERTRALAKEAGIEEVPDDQTMVKEADVFLSILPPDKASGLAERVAQALTATGASLLYADCNAVSPGTVKRVAETVTAVGARFADVGIIGGPPAPGRSEGTVFYASGPGAEEFVELGEFGLHTALLGGDTGQASGLKMCFAAFTKGQTALITELLVAAKRMGLYDALHQEWQRPSGRPASGSTAPVSAQLQAERSIPSMPPKAYRWVPEMLEIAATFRELGLTPRILEGASDMYELVGHTPLANETPETRVRGTTVEDVVQILAEALD
ncbi:MAG: NAD(P)-dependent oxidoreductase [Chloroflexi bacterium]|nr:NAD(P)-dependent oxidoreductase [Chloroflexota bacterium]